MNNLETLRFELDDNVARVTLDRPDAAEGIAAFFEKRRASFSGH